MKKICLIIFLLCSFIIRVNALISFELKDPFISFDKEEDFNLQGFTTVDNKLFCVFIDPNDSKSRIKIFDLDTNKLIKSFDYTSLGHANDVAYNSKENKIYVLHGAGKKELHVFDGKTFEYIEDKQTSIPLRSFTYIDDKDLYAGRSISVGFYFDNNYQMVQKVPFIMGLNFTSDVAKQGWTYHKGMLYYSTWSWIRKGGNGTNTIYVYSLSGDARDKIITEGNIGELEDVDFYDEKIILGINTYDNHVQFYKYDIPEIKKIVKEEIEDVQEQKKNYLPIIVLVISCCLLLILLIIRIRKKV